VAIKELRIDQLRNLVDVSIKPGPGINVLHGANASGKTSLLEAIYLLIIARSFRSQKMHRIIQQDKTHATVCAKLNITDRCVFVGMQRNLNGDHQLRIDGVSVNTAAQLAGAVALQLIEPASFQLFVGGPSKRRRFIDWGAFHHYPSFLSYWRQLQRLLKQRNGVLKFGKMDDCVRLSFEQGFVSAANAVDQLRQNYIQQLEPVFTQVLNELLALPDFGLSYYRGWSRERDLAAVLESSLQRDMAVKHTHYGPHRADLRLQVNGQDAVDILSRGQQKLVIIAMKLAQGILLTQALGKPCVYLVDDLSAELDQHYRRKVCQQLSALKNQVFVTCVSNDDLADCWPEAVSVKMFHVKHGQLIPN